MRIKITPEELKAIIDATESKFQDQRSLASVRTKLYQGLGREPIELVLLANSDDEFQHRARRGLRGGVLRVIQAEQESLIAEGRYPDRKLFPLSQAGDATRAIAREEEGS